MNNADRSGLISLAEALGKFPRPTGEHSLSLLQRGTLNVKLAFSPPMCPTQRGAHAQDEVYVIARGRGALFHDGKRDPFQAGDLLFVAAGVDHCFEDFSKDLSVWVIFFGPNGGEIPT
jgi:mannose-6-phosphate isomerase-like protein (cupin superfamily)